MAFDAIVFVHGIYGGDGTFRNAETAFDWPIEFPRTVMGRKVDVYRLNYESQMLGWSAQRNVRFDELAQSVFDVMQSLHRKRYRSIGFVAHSLGGIVVTTYLHKVKLRYGHDALAQYGYVVTLATPYLGSLILPSFAGGKPPESLAIALGGVVLAAAALKRLAEELSQLAGAAIAWREARPLSDAASCHAPTSYDEAGPVPDGVPVVQLRDVTYKYPSRAAPVLLGCTLRIEAGDRVLLEGPSGGGKSTLASIVAGVRTATSGLVLAGGFDHATLGPHGWRKRVVCAPQFHENHVFCETFAFNLLMGRPWPASPADMVEAETVARELSLGALLERMPAGMMQMVGEGGWQLSHGERSRLFIARTLLQGGDLVVLDESLASLDPETSQVVLDCIVARARSLLVIAHE